MTDIRKIAPEIKTISDIILPDIKEYKLPNGITIYELNGGTQDVIKVELVNIGGRLLEDKILSSRTTAILIKEASKSYKQHTLAEKIDYYGASVRTSYNMDMTSLSMYSLGKHYKEMVNILSDVYLNPIFPKSDFEKYIQRNINNLKVELTKNDVIAYRDFTEEIFGRDHVYGYNSQEDDYSNLRVDDLLHHYKTYYGSNNSIIFLSGRITNEMRQMTIDSFGNTNKNSPSKEYQESKTTFGRNEIKRKGKNNYQNSIVIGRKLFRKSHSDYSGMLVLNTILGGYFGSRLMKKVREEKGYTYNISSFIDILKYDGFLFISTEVAPKNLKPTLKVIYNEIKKLQENLVPPDELQMVKNYIYGNILNMLDGPFKSSKWVKSIISHDMSIQDGYNIINNISSITSERLRDLARNYLAKKELTELIVA